MSKKSIIAILSAVVLMVVASLALVFTIGPKTSAADEDETVYLVPTKYLNLTNDGKTLGDNSFNGWNAFNAAGNTWIQNHAKYRVEIPAGVTSIGTRAFYGCSGLTGSITIPETVTNIGNQAFFYCSGLTSVTFAENSQLTSIGDGAFFYCSGLTSITIPEGVTSIDDYAFYNCSGLTSITIPEGVTSIGEDAFCDCSGLNEIIVRNEDLLTNTELQRYASILHYGADQNTVKFVTNCDTAIDDRLIDFGVVTTEPTGLTKEHYTFAGWYSDEQCTKPFTFDTPIKYDITLYAKWEAVQAQPKPETQAEENAEVNNQNNNALIWGIAGTAAGILIVAGIIVGIVISKRRRK